MDTAWYFRLFFVNISWFVISRLLFGIIKAKRMSGPGPSKAWVIAFWIALLVGWVLTWFVTFSINLAFILWFYFVLYVVLSHLAVLNEEKQNIERFGQEYVGYMNKIPRYVGIPKSAKK